MSAGNINTLTQNILKGIKIIRLGESALKTGWKWFSLSSEASCSWSVASDSLTANYSSHHCLLVSHEPAAGWFCLTVGCENSQEVKVCLFSLIASSFSLFVKQQSLAKLPPCCPGFLLWNTSGSSEASWSTETPQISVLYLRYPDKPQGGAKVSVTHISTDIQTRLWH